MFTSICVSFLSLSFLVLFCVHLLYTREYQFSLWINVQGGVSMTFTNFWHSYVQGRLYSCTKSTADTLYVEFTCDSQCAENDIQFWYRLVLGDTAGEFSVQFLLKGKGCLGTVSFLLFYLCHPDFLPPPLFNGWFIVVFHPYFFYSFSSKKIKVDS